MAAEKLKEPTKRILLWGPPRSLSTVFEKCMSYVDGIQIINEPYITAFNAGPERKIGGNNMVQDGVVDFMNNAREEVKSIEDITGWDDEICTYQWVKDTLEAEYPNKKLVFVKDLIPGIVDKFHMLPRGYRHTFLIRNPTKVVVSLRKLVIKTFLPAEFPVEMFRLDEMIKMSGEYDVNKFIFGEMIDLIAHLKKEGMQEEEPIIIDADDLQNHPQSILRQYCEAVGIPYSDSLLKWEAGDDIVKKNWLTSKSLLHGNKTGNYYAGAFASTEFQPASDPPSGDDVPDDVKELIAKAEPFYQKLYEKRIKP